MNQHQIYRGWEVWYFKMPSIAGCLLWGGTAKKGTEMIMLEGDTPIDTLQKLKQKIDNREGV